MKPKDRKLIEEAAKTHEHLCQAMWDAMVQRLADQTGLDAGEVEELFAQLT